MRPTPELPLSETPTTYARLAAWGWDTIQEAYPMGPDGALLARLEAAKTLAQESRGNGAGVAKIDVGGSEWLCHASGAKGGVAYRLENDDLIFLIRSDNCEWGVSVRYKAVGLWEHGWQALRAFVLQFMDGNFVSRAADDPRISRADYAFDFFSPEFSREFNLETLRRCMVMHSSSKYRSNAKAELTTFGTSIRDQTLTMGNIGNLQLTVYNKSDEVNEISGKTWFEEVWARMSEGEVLYAGKPADVWRIEVRMGKRYLKERNCQRFAEFQEFHRELIAEGLLKLRLSTPGENSHARQRPIHPLWSEAYRHIDAGHGELLPLGRRVLGRRSVLVARAISSLGGMMRTASVLSGGDFDEEAYRVISMQAYQKARADPQAAKKEQGARDRYEFVDEAR